MQCHPSTCIAGPKDIISLPATQHQACEVCGWHTEGFENITFAPETVAEQLLESGTNLTAGAVVMGFIESMGHIGEAEWFARQELRSRIRRWQQKWRRAGGSQVLTASIPAAEMAPQPVPQPETEPIVPIEAEIKKKIWRSGGRHPDEFKTERWSIIRKIYKDSPELKGQDFWKAVEERGGKPNRSWMAEEDCPSTLTKAYADSKWTKRLNQDKTDATKPLRESLSSKRQNRSFDFQYY